MRESNMRMGYHTKLLSLGALFVATFGLQSAHGAVIELLNWAPSPDSINPPFAEINYTGANLTTGAGRDQQRRRQSPS